IWRKDFLQYSHIHHPMIAQLFGINLFPLPSLLFHEDLIPLHYIMLESRKYSPLARSALHFRVILDWISVQQAVLKLRKYSHYRLRRNCWLNPKTGGIVYGPSSRALDKEITFQLSFLCFYNLQLEIHPLSADNYFNETVLLRHYEGLLKMQGFKEGFLGLSAHYRQYWGTSYSNLSLTEINRLSHPLEIGAIFDYRNIVAHIPVVPKLTISHWYVNKGMIERTLLQNGWTRFKFETPQFCSDFRICQDVKLGEDQERFLRAAYLAQHHHLQLSTESNLHLFDAVEIKLENPIMHSISPLSRPLYLFVAPMELRESLSEMLSEWQRQGIYYWSFDLTGKRRLRRDTAEKFYNIPWLEPRISMQARGSWAEFYYDAARRVQELEGFDPCTTDYARGHGYPIVEVFSKDDNAPPDTVFDPEMPLAAAAQSDTNLYIHVHTMDEYDEHEDYIHPRANRYLSTNSPKWWKAAVGFLVPKYRRRNCKPESLDGQLGIQKEHKDSRRKWYSSGFKFEQPRFKRRSAIW
ncbi:hypothetical protein K435DRAFT_780326, partial [Dendrothele bispora CBS 962.96]